jgi:beta-glucosidase
MTGIYLKEAPMFPFQDSSLPLSARVTDLLSRMTLSEKISFLPARHPAVERLGLQEFHLGGEGAHGVVMRDGSPATVFPQPYGLSMTWDKPLLKRIGGVIGDEARVYYKKRDRGGSLVLFYPTIDMERDPRWGRNEEAYGEDPFLAGRLAVELIRGAQGEDGYFLKTANMAKHFYTNNYEYERTYIDSVIADERLKYEYYLRVFEYAVTEGGARSMMTAYNKINGCPGIMNPELNEIVRGKWGHDGFYASDGGAFGLLFTDHRAFETYAECVAACLKAGLDAFLDNPKQVMEAAEKAVEAGLLTEADIDTALTHQFNTLFRLGVYGGSGGNPYENIPDDVLCCDAHAELARQAAREAVVLIKNDGLLPLNKAVKRIAVVGQLGGENMPDWYSGTPPYEVTPLAGIRKAFPDCEVTYADGCDRWAFKSEADGAWLRVNDDGSITLDGDTEGRSVFRVSDWGYGSFGFMDTVTGKYLTTDADGYLKCDSDAIWGWFTRELFFMRDGRFVPEKAFRKSPLEGVATGRDMNIYDKIYNDGGVDRVNSILEKLTPIVITDGLSEAANAARNADIAVAVLGNHSLIGARECIDRSDLTFPERFAALFSSVREANANTVLTLTAGYPYDISKQEAQARAVIFTSHGAQELGTAIGETLSGANNPAGRLSQTWYYADEALPDINDYDIVKNKMTYLYHEGEALHEFGYGLSYSRFGYADLSLNNGENGGADISFTLSNVSGADGDEVVQVYVSGEALRPIKKLAGFERVHLKAGEATRVALHVPEAELSYYDTQKGAFVFAPGEYKFYIGASSKDIRLEGVLSI